jgi:hypothetical protein
MRTCTFPQAVVQNIEASYEPQIMTSCWELILIGVKPSAVCSPHSATVPAALLPAREFGSTYVSFLSTGTPGNIIS